MRQHYQGREAELENLQRTLTDFGAQLVEQTAKARRELKFELTAGTRNLRRPINYSSYALLAIFLSGFILFSSGINELVQGNAPAEMLITAFGHQFTFAAAFGAMSLFFIHWNQRWFRNHADDEFSLKRFDIDFDRASWIVETALD